MIQLTDKYYLGNDKYCWKLMTKGNLDKKTGQQRYNGEKYYASVGQALVGLADVVLRDQDYQTLGELKNAVEDVRELLLRISGELNIEMDRT